MNAGAAPAVYPPSEIAVLGALLLNYAKAIRETTGLSVSDFADPACRRLFAEIEAAASKNEPTTSEAMMTRRQPEDLIGQCISKPADIGSIGWNSDQIRGASRKRALGVSLDRARRELDSADFSAEAVAADLAGELAQASPDGSGTAPARALSDIPRSPDCDPNELLRHRFLCRGGALLLVGPAGVGKSALLIQLLLSWAAGRVAVGIAPTRPLRSVLIQSEDDDGDLAEMRDGILLGLVEAGTLTRAEADAAARAVFVMSAPDAQGDKLPPLLRRMIAQHKPDLLALNPAFGFVSGDTNKAQDVGGFLRGTLNPIIKAAGVGLVLVHHSNKPPSGREKSDWRAGENAYLGAGSAEWANFSRAVLAVRSLGSPSLFELVAGKRGGRLRWADADGAPTTARHIAHALEPGRIFWRDPDAEEVSAAIAGDVDRMGNRAPGRQAEGDAAGDAHTVSGMFMEGAYRLTDARRMIGERLAGKRRGERAFDELTRDPGIYGLHIARAAWHGTGFLGTFSAAKEAADALSLAKGISGNEKLPGNEPGETP